LHPDEHQEPIVTDDSKDPFDPAVLRLRQDFLATGGVVKHWTKIPVRKPSRDEWFRLRPDGDYTNDTLLLELKETREYYLIAQHLHA
jgi:hypothetical protein